MERINVVVNVFMNGFFFNNPLYSYKNALYD